MRYPFKIVFVSNVNHSAKVFHLGRIRDLSVVTHLDTSCHTFGPHWHTLRDRSCVDRLSSPCESVCRN